MERAAESRGGVGEFGGGVGHDGFVLPGEVEEEGDGDPRRRAQALRPYGLIFDGNPRSDAVGSGYEAHALPRLKYQSHAGGVEHAGGGVDLFVEVLGFDEGVLATPAGDDGIDVGAIGGEDLANVVGVDHEEAFAIVVFFGILGMTDLL